jgi:hypothetical protein
MSVNLKEIAKTALKEQYFRLDYGYEFINLAEGYMDDFVIFNLNRDAKTNSFYTSRLIDDVKDNENSITILRLNSSLFIKKYLQKHIDCQPYTIGNQNVLVHEDRIITLGQTMASNFQGICQNGAYESFANDIVEIANECLKDIKVENDGTFILAFYSRDYGEINTQKLEYTKLDCDLKKNYNDDLPDNKIRELVNSDKNKLLVFYGKPGTGKTSYIKSLMNDAKKKFIFMDASMFGSVGSEQFLEFLANNKDTVFVFEDCEKMITKRDSNNSNMSTLLNLTDGLLGDAFKIKIICTFNTDLHTIDPALLRKGRLSLKYEFKELSLEKTKVFVPTATKKMTLADVYNMDEENDYSKREDKIIGFLK